MTAQQKFHGNGWHWLWRQSWAPTAVRKLAYKKLSDLGEPPDSPFEIDFFGLRYKGNLNNGIEFAMYHYGAFEKPLLFFLRDAIYALKQVRKSDEGAGIFHDIGANIGQHALFMSQYADQVHAFEPYHVVAGKLRQHIALNSISNITLHELGLSDKNGNETFFAPTGNNKGVGSFDSGSQHRGNRAVGELAIRRGDDYLSEHGISRVSLMKIDVEGFERNVLTGLRQTLEENRPVIVCEISYGGLISFQSKDEMLGCLPENYQLLRFDTRKNSGKTARRRGAKSKRTGNYRLLPVTSWRDTEQDDLIAVPKELMSTIPQQNN